MNELTIVDISEWQGEIDYSVLASKADVVIMRVSIGLQEDDRYAENYAGLYPYTELEEDDPNHVKLGGYHGHLDWLNTEGQADIFSDLIAGKLLEWGVWADFERDVSGHSQATLANLYYIFLENIVTTAPVVGIYTAGWFWNAQIGFQLSGYFLTYPLWFAHYTNDFDNVIIPVPWKSVEAWYMHQYSADGNNRGAEFGVSSDDIDINRINPELLPPPPVPPMPEGFKFIVRSTTLNYRTEPSTSNGNATVVGKLGKDDIVVATGFKVENAENVWASHTVNEEKVWSAIVHRNYKYMDAVEE